MSNKDNGKNIKVSGSVGINSKSLKCGSNHQLLNCDEADQEFIMLAEYIDLGQDQLDQVLENFDDIAFDSLGLEAILGELSLPFMANKIFQKYDFLDIFHIPAETLFSFAKEITHGYFKENAYHNSVHIVDSL